MKMRAIALLAALTVSTTATGFAQQTSQEQVICNLASQNCLRTTEDMQMRIKKMNAEMKTGKVYSTEDVQKLERKLKEAQEILDRLEGKAPGR